MGPSLCSIGQQRRRRPRPLTFPPCVVRLGSHPRVTQDGAAPAQRGMSLEGPRISYAFRVPGKDRGSSDSGLWLTDLLPGPFLQFICKAER